MQINEIKVLREIAAEFEKETALTVRVEEVPYGEFRVKYQTAAPAGLGPDLITGPQDWIGPMVIAQLIDNLTPSDISTDELKAYNEISLKCLTFDGNLYGLPFFLETIALIYNKDLVKKLPKTMEEVCQIAKEITENAEKTGEKKYGIAFEMDNFYFAWPFLSGFGAYIFNDKTGVIDPEDIGLSNDGAITACRYLQKIKDLSPGGVNTDMANGLFKEGKIAFIINGPWVVNDYKLAGVPLGVIPLPKLPNGEYPHPFVGVQGIMLNKKATHRDNAIKFMKYLNRPENQEKLYNASGRIPSRMDVLEKVMNDGEIKQFAYAAKLGFAMPNHPAINAVWEPMHQALKLILFDKEDPAVVLPQTVKNIKKDIKIMME